MHPNDPDHGTRHEWEVVEPRRLHALPRRRAAVLLGVRLPGPADLGHAAPSRLRAPTEPADQESTRRSCCTRRRRTATASSTAAWPATCGVPDDFADWHWATQLNQARAIQYAVEHYRSWWPRTAGSIVWQLNDCWPVTSWAAVDGDGRRKPLWYALRRAYAPACSPSAAGAASSPWSTTATRRGRACPAAPPRASTAPCSPTRTSRSTCGAGPSVQLAAARDCSRPPTPPARCWSPTRGHRDPHLFAEDRDLAYDPGAVGVVTRGWRADTRSP